MTSPHEAQRIADVLGGTAFPDGKQWRCIRPDCEFTTDDDGPDRCPAHDVTLWRRTVALTKEAP